MHYAYIRVSTDKQTTETQRFEILKFADAHKLSIDQWIEETVSGTKQVQERQLGRLALGEAALLAAEWRALACQGAAAAVRDEQATDFANQAPRMAYNRYRAAGWDIGSGMVESGCKYLIGAREKGPGMRWGAAGANTVAQVRVLLFNDQWDDDRAAV